MKNLLEFNPNRLWQLLKLEATTKNKRALMVFAAALGVLLLYQFLLIYNRDHDAYNWINETFGGLLIFGGLLYTSYSFSELTDNSTSMTYLTLPASNFEKFVSKWLFSTVGFYVVYLVGYSIFAFIGLSLANTVFDFKGESFAPFVEENLICTKVYFVVSSIFLLGAITFKSYHAPKTVLSLVGLTMFIGSIAYLIVRVVMYDFFDGWAPIDNAANVNLRPNQSMVDFMEGPFVTIMKWLFWLVLPLFFWTVSFFKLKEKEIG